MDCPRCDGKGTQALHGIAIPMDQFMEEWDEQSREDYFAGLYDTPCSMCGGKGEMSDEDLEYFWERDAEIKAGC